MTDSLSYFSAVLVQQHIDELRSQAATDRLVRGARKSRRGRRRVAALVGLRPAAAR